MNHSHAVIKEALPASLLIGKVLTSKISCIWQLIINSKTRKAPWRELCYRASCEAKFFGVVLLCRFFLVNAPHGMKKDFPQFTAKKANKNIFHSHFAVAKKGLTSLKLSSCITQTLVG